MFFFLDTRKSKNNTLYVLWKRLFPLITLMLWSYSNEGGKPQDKPWYLTEGLHHLPLAYSHSFTSHYSLICTQAVRMLFPLPKPSFSLFFLLLLLNHRVWFRWHFWEAFYELQVLLNFEHTEPIEKDLKFVPTALPCIVLNNYTVNPPRPLVTDFDSLWRSSKRCQGCVETTYHSFFFAVRANQQSRKSFNF